MIVLPLHQYLSNQLVFLTVDYLIKTAEKLRRSGEHKCVAELCDFLGVHYWVLIPFNVLPPPEIDQISSKIVPSNPIG